MSTIETQNIEFKQRWRDDFLAELCGFANAQGGTLYIGVDDKGVPVGVEDAKKLLEKLPNLINQTLGLLATVDLLDKGGKQCVAITVPATEQPISYRGIPRGNQTEPLNEKGDKTQLNENQQKVYDYICVMAQSDEPLNEPLNTTRIAKELGMAYSTVKRVMKSLEENNLIRRVGSKKTGYWEIVANAIDSQSDSQKRETTQL